MGIWWSKLSLQIKLQLPIQLALLVLLVTVQYVALNKFEEHILEESRQKALVSADGLLNGLNMMMNNGDISDQAQRSVYIKNMSGAEKIVELRVMRGKAVQEQFGRGLASEQPVDELDKTALKSAQIQTYLASRDDRYSLRVVIPFVAKKDFRGTNCLMCHMVKEGAVTGAASITLDLSEEYAGISRANYVLWGVQILVQVAMFLLIAWLLDKVTRSTRKIQDVMLSMNAEVDLSRRVEVNGQDEIGKTAQAFNGLLYRITNIIREILDNAVNFSKAIAYLATSSVQIEKSLDTQSETAAAAAKAAEQILARMKSLAENTEIVQRLSENNMQQTLQGSQGVAAMMDEIRRVQKTVSQIAFSVRQYIEGTHAIGDISRHVKDVADQSNLLALNLTIEAARAGEHGRSFSAVVDQVRNLADKSAKSACEVDHVVSSLNQKSINVESVVQTGLGSLHTIHEQMEHVYQTLVELGETASNSSHGVNDIAMAANEQCRTGNEISQDLEKIMKLSEETHEAVRSNIREIEHLEQLAIELQGAVSRFRVQ